MDNFTVKANKNLIKFYKELDRECQSTDRDAKRISVLFATKYLNSGELAQFIEIYKEFRKEAVYIGENRVQDAYEKFGYLERERPDLAGTYRKVFIGNLQKNKVNKAIAVFDEIWGVDGISLAQEIDNRVRPKIMPVFLEVNVSGEASKHGIGLMEAEKTIEQVTNLRNIKLKGLMTMAPETDNRAEIIEIFKILRQLANKYHLLASMGMSGDWKEAVFAGSDVLRIGSRIFKSPDKV